MVSSFDAGGRASAGKDAVVRSLNNPTEAIVVQCKTLETVQIAKTSWKSPILFLSGEMLGEVKLAVERRNVDNA